ncbi:MAG TPA: M28 family metallopeptidase [Candidatus Dormibacteraeota bacterium]|jgi:Zn-dependent M28 family amino/carboxypeptidase|nr:M28 family metallopeptidase [Candidatus Dormibacteraeota bacterium]
MLRALTSALSVFAVSFVVFPASAQMPPQSHFDGKSWWEHVKVLADDNMEGRETGSDGLRRAQAYVVDQLKKNGIEPAGTDGFYQPIKLIQRQVNENDSSAALLIDAKPQTLVPGDDILFSSRCNTGEKPIAAPLVFVGYGLKVPEKNLDDLTGQDLSGKIAVFISGSPSDVPSALASHYSTFAERWKSLRAAGAIGTITILNPASMDIPWSRIALNRLHPSMDLADAEFNESEGLKLALTFNPAQAEKLFLGSGHTFSELAALAKDRKPLPRFALPASVQAHVSIQSSEVQSANLVAKLAGTDPSLKNEFVVLSAHLDHLGIGEPINGDRIYNGAMDDGSGCALLLDVAASLKSHPEKLSRSLLFVFVTGEEKGLLGSRYFATHPTVAPKSIVADANVDMFLPIVPLKFLEVKGLEESDLGDRAAAVAASLGVKAIPDQEPLRNRFIRSDQYSFIVQGIPSVKMDVGFLLGSPEQKIFKDWLTNRYHAPSDDLDQPKDLSAAALYEEIIRRLLVDTANNPSRPQWKPNSFFRRYVTN